MQLFRFLFRILIVITGAVIGLALFLLAVFTFAVVLLVSLLRGRKPDVQFRMNRNPWAQRRHESAPADVVDIEAREVREPEPLPLPPLQPPRR